MDRLAFISGCGGYDLTPGERAFFKQARPLGLIIFDRNINNKEQVQNLINDVRDTVGADQFWVLIDQEGGRVQRLKPPLFRTIPPAQAFLKYYQQQPDAAKNAAYLAGALVGSELRVFGLNMNCIPVLDVVQSGAHDIIGNRAYGSNPEHIIALGGAFAEGHMSVGVCPVMKHIPGHGRANADSHLALPVVETAVDELQEIDFKPFHALNTLPLAMTAHLLLPAIDDIHPVSTSKTIIDNIIRTIIGFDGFLLSDDLSMKALSGPIGKRAKDVLAAGCDGVLHCNGDLTEMEEVAMQSGRLDGLARQRFKRSFDMGKERLPFDRDQAIAALAEISKFSV